jgi:hypothetical protein
VTKFRPLLVAIWTGLYGLRTPLSQWSMSVTDTVAARVQRAEPYGRATMVRCIVAARDFYEVIRQGFAPVPVPTFGDAAWLRPAMVIPPPPMMCSNGSVFRTGEYREITSLAQVSTDSGDLVHMIEQVQEAIDESLRIPSGLLKP